MASERNSISCEYYPEFKDKIIDRISGSLKIINEYIENRLQKHAEFIRQMDADKISKCYENESMGILVKTRQEIKNNISLIDVIEVNGDEITGIAQSK